MSERQKTTAARDIDFEQDCNTKQGKKEHVSKIWYTP
jgi:hypothetical protein